MTSLATTTVTDTKTTTTVSTESTTSTTTTVSTKSTTSTTSSTSPTTSKSVKKKSMVQSILIFLGAACSTACTSQQTCVNGVCVGIGYLSVTLTWSQNGDGDIVVTTPTNKLIYYGNRGPTTSTDQGELDVDDMLGKGPENVFWSTSSSVPPTGTYYVCFSQYSFSPSASSTYPLAATVKIARSNNTALNFTKNFTAIYQNTIQCDSFSNTFLGSFTYP